MERCPDLKAAAVLAPGAIQVVVDCDKISLQLMVQRAYIDVKGLVSVAGRGLVPATTQFKAELPFVAIKAR